MSRYLFCSVMMAICCLSSLQAVEQPKKVMSQQSGNDKCPNDKCVAEEILACSKCD